MTLTEQQILKSIQAKSDQLNAVDLVAGPIDVTIEGASYGNSEQPFVLKISGGYQPYKPCKTMRSVIVKAWGLNAQQWVGRSMRLFSDPKVKWAGEEVGGIRISHMSHIDGQLVVQVNVTRGKKQAITIQPLMVEVVEESRIVQCIAALLECKTADALAKVMQRAEGLIRIASDDQNLRIEAARDEVLEGLK